MSERATIQNCIEAVAELVGSMDIRAEREAMHDRYITAAEFQTLARGLRMAVAKLEEMKQGAP